MIEKDELQLGPQHNDLKVPVNALLKNAEGLGFALGRLPVNTFLLQNKDQLFQGIDETDVEPTTGAFKKLHRLYQITPTDGALQFALNEGFASAADVASVPYDLFMASYKDKFAADPKISAEIADLFYRKSQLVSSVTYNFFTAAKQMETRSSSLCDVSASRVLQSRQERIDQALPYDGDRFSARSISVNANIADRY